MYRTLLATCGSTDFEYFFILILGESFPRSHTLLFMLMTKQKPKFF